MEQKQNAFRRLMEDTDTFIVTCEHIPGRVSREKSLDNIIGFAEQCLKTGLVHALSLTDNPGGTPALLPDPLVREIEQLGLPAIVHFTAKDMNRNMLEARALSLDRMDIKNLLVMSGDYQTLGKSGLPMPVFDIDPVHILNKLTLMNKGWRIGKDTRTLEECPRTDFSTALLHRRTNIPKPVLCFRCIKWRKKPVRERIISSRSLVLMRQS